MDKKRARLHFVLVVAPDPSYWWGQQRALGWSSAAAPGTSYVFFV
jgi:hypothetical protein